MSPATWSRSAPDTGIVQCSSPRSTPSPSHVPRTSSPISKSPTSVLRVSSRSEQYSYQCVICKGECRVLLLIDGTPSRGYGVSLAIWDHSVIFHPTQVNTPRLNLCQTGGYSIYLPLRDGRLSWPRWLITYRDGFPAHRRWSIQVLTRQITAGNRTCSLLLSSVGQTMADFY